ncbi:MAG: MotA/TolQ/ExbB proton channel family protein [Ignavibacteria bacterium]|jgi:biopolymer transport protein ExbB|nr:flagellar motor protein MotA [Chlorobiota bacterium]
MDQFSYVVIGVAAVLFAFAGVSYALFRSFNSFIVFLWLGISAVIWGLFMGAPGNFKDGFLRHDPLNTLGTIHTGGPLVAALLGMLFIAITYVVERYLVISKARGTGDLHAFMKNVQAQINANDVKSAIDSCAAQKGSLSNIVRSGLERYSQVEHDQNFDPEKKIAEVQRAIDEAMNLETPLLEKNLVILSTVASLATMVGLLGTTIGMIRSFAALGASGGAVSAQALSIGISEALYNTAFGLGAAIISILAFNFFTTKVDNFVYMIDEAVLTVMETLTIKTKK